MYSPVQLLYANKNFKNLYPIKQFFKNEKEDDIPR
jgi:hypothetical protein